MSLQISGLPPAATPPHPPLGAVRAARLALSTRMARRLIGTVG